MANPTPYERGYSFAGFQSTSPQTPLPGQRVDEELDNLERTTGETITALADIRRADGKLKNGIVTLDALSAEVMTGIQPAVEWTTSTQYNPGAVVFFNTGFYRCLVEHVSGVFATDLAAGKWELFADLSPIVTEAGTARDEAVAAAATASSAASTATTQAGTAAAAASAATTQAGNAATSAGTATTQAGVATTKATEAAASAAAALASELAAEAAAATVINGFQKRVRYSAADGNLSAGQTVFTVPGGYDPNEASVYRSGLYLANGVDVDVSSGTTFTLTTPVGASDVVIFEAYGVFNIAAVQASVVTYDNTASGLAATTAQAAIDKVVERMGVVTAADGKIAVWDNTNSKLKFVWAAPKSYEIDLRDLMDEHYGAGAWTYRTGVNAGSDIVPAIAIGLDRIRSTIPNGRGRIMIPPGDWIAKTVIDKAKLSGIVIEGVHSQASKIITAAGGNLLDCNGAGGFTGGAWRRLALMREDGFSSACVAMNLQGDATNQPDQFEIEDIYCTAIGSGFWTNCLLASGQSRTGPQGLRVISLRNVQCFKAGAGGGYAIGFFNVVQGNAENIGSYSGTGAAGNNIYVGGGGSALTNTTQLKLGALACSGELNLTNAVDVVISGKTTTMAWATSFDFYDIFLNVTGAVSGTGGSNGRTAFL